MDERESTRENYVKMTQTPVGRLIASLALPATVSVLITNVYSMADTYFVSGLGVNESGATGIVYALMGVIQSVGFLFGTGAGSIIAIQLGKGENENAKRFCATTVYFGITVGIILAILGAVFIRPLMYVLGSTDLILEHAVSYGIFILIALPIMIGAFILNNTYRYEGKALIGMIGLAAGGLLNILGDFLLIRVFGWGIEGAGLATCVSQYISFIILVIPFFFNKSHLSLHPRYVTRDFGLIKRVVLTGLPSLIRQGLFSVSSLTLNHCAAMVGEEFAIAAMSIVGRIVNLIYSLALGIGHGFQPVSGFNFGAKRYDRVKRSMVFMIIYAIMWLTVLAVAGYVLADNIIILFRDDPQIIDIAVVALRAQCVVLPILPLQICGNMSHQAVGDVVRTAILASFRSGLFFIPFVIIGSRVFGLAGLEFAQPAADVVATAVSLPFLIALFRRLTSMEKPSDRPDQGTSLI